MKGLQFDLNEMAVINGKALTIAITLTVICCGFLLPLERENNKKINEVFGSQLEQLIKKLTDLKKSSKQKATLQVLQKQFKESRLTYKKAATIIEYFYAYESRSLNGPALPRVEDDNPYKIFPPHGFQVIEELIFAKWKSSYRTLDAELDGMLVLLNKFKNQSYRELLLTDRLTWDAIRNSVIKLTAMGISGFDSPIAQYSMLEGAATLEGIQQLLKAFSPQTKDETDCLSALNLLFTDGIIKLKKSSFSSFDRMKFIRTTISPSYSLIIQNTKLFGAALPKERRPVNLDAKSFFDPEFFDLSFFSPNERYRLTPERVQLGRKLFYDPVLSATRNRTCGSCHKPELAFTDGLKTALSVDRQTYLKRNTPTLINSAFQTKQFFDSRTSVLENQLSDVVHNQEEMKGSLKQSVTDLQNDKAYDSLFRAAYPNDESPISQYNIANAISNFTRSLISLNSRFDQYVRGDTTKMSSREVRGFNLFMGKAKCATCHFIPLFNGLVPPEFTETESEVLGVPINKNQTKTSLDPDLGKYNFTKAVIHKHSFKTPTLRNIELTAPYMHNGVYSTLEEVMDFYNKGGGSGLKIAPENQTLPADQLKLTKKEISEMIAFLKTLTDQGQ
jgi:cytochrome c peroxidase